MGMFQGSICHSALPSKEAVRKSHWGWEAEDSRWPWRSLMGGACGAVLQGQVPTPQASRANSHVAGVR